MKLLGDLSALVGPLSIYHIVEYIQSQQQYRNQERYAEHKLHKDIHKANGSHVSNGSVSIGHWGYGTGATHTTTSMPSSSNDVATIAATIQDAIIYYPGWGELLSNGWVIAWLVLLSSLVQGALSQAATHIVNMIGIRIKTSLQGLVYRKTLLLSSSCLYKPADGPAASIPEAPGPGARKGRNGGESTETDSLTLAMSAKDVGAITNLMSEDALNVMTFFWIAHYVWSIPLKVGPSETSR